MLHDLVVLDVAVFMQKIPDRLVDLFVDFGGFCREKPGHLRSVVMGFLFRIHGDRRF